MKPYGFRRIRTLRIALTLFVWLIMCVAGVISGIILLILRKLDILPAGYATTFMLPLLTIASSLLFGSIITAIFGRRFLNPIRELSRALNEVSKGDFSVRVPVSDFPLELARLQRSFNDMAEDLSGIELFRNDFIDNFSHEFKTPIVSIRGFARQLKRESLSKEQRDEYIDIIVRESERLSKLSTNVLLLSKLENQKIVTNKTRFYLDEQLRNCILLLEKQWSEKEIELKLDMDEINYYSNEELLSQAWLNLLSNAIKISEPHGEIEVVCAKANGNVMIIIADNGEGMDEETMRHAFEKFYQGDPSRASEGNGIGLSIVKRIIDLCGGSVSVESEVGKGTRFTVTLPGTEL